MGTSPSWRGPRHAAASDAPRPVPAGQATIHLPAPRATPLRTGGPATGRATNTEATSATPRLPPPPRAAAPTTDPGVAAPDHRHTLRRFVLRPGTVGTPAPAVHRKKTAGRPPAVLWPLSHRACRTGSPTDEVHRVGRVGWYGGGLPVFLRSLLGLCRVLRLKQARQRQLFLGGSAAAATAHLIVQQMAKIAVSPIHAASLRVEAAPLTGPIVMPGRPLRIGRLKCFGGRAGLRRHQRLGQFVLITGCRCLRRSLIRGVVQLKRQHFDLPFTSGGALLRAAATHLVMLEVAKPALLAVLAAPLRIEAAPLARALEVPRRPDRRQLLRVHAPLQARRRRHRRDHVRVRPGPGGPGWHPRANGGGRRRE
mmetsp:Transcript_2880/g.6525  ORF Transcript_2880/g.6525 Transcript_2880/m.6525 type:complete len:367 (-) Transcript_2880:202-1302(-)